MKKSRWGVWVSAILLVVLSGGALEACSLSDLRPQTLRTTQDLASSQEKGRALMQKVAKHYGVDAWHGHQTLEVHMEDRWPDFWVQSMLGWWPQHPQHLILQTQNAQASVRAVLLDGEWEGHRLGLHEGLSWRQETLESPLTWEQEKISTFYLVSLHYFNELPFQLAQADVTQYAGEKELRGQTYQLVLVSWRRAQPHQEHDQYLVWINARTMHIEMCTYTVRDAFASATGTIHYNDFRRVQGVLLPFQQRVVLDPPDKLSHLTEEDVFHETRIQKAVFDAFPPAELHVTPDKQP